MFHRRGKAVANRLLCPLVTDTVSIVTQTRTKALTGYPVPKSVGAGEVALPLLPLVHGWT